MATMARDRLGRTLRGEAQTAFSVDLTAKADDLSLEVEGFGHVRFPGKSWRSPQARPRRRARHASRWSTLLAAAIPSPSALSHPG